jgi:hypothetical protein
VPPLSGAKPSAAALPTPKGGQAGLPAARAAQAGKRRGRGGRFFGRVREVFMGGKWVQVRGKGPVISEDESSAREEKEP